MSWNSYFMKMAALVASKSKDRSTKVGCVIVGPDNEVRSTGYNGFPRGVRDDIEDRQANRAHKLALTCHSEANAVFSAARVGTPLKGCRIYVTAWPCNECAKAIIQAGIAEVIAPEPSADLMERWRDSFEASLVMLTEAGVKQNFFAEECE